MIFCGRFRLSGARMPSRFAALLALGVLVCIGSSPLDAGDRHLPRPDQVSPLSYFPLPSEPPPSEDRILPISGPLGRFVEEILLEVGKAGSGSNLENLRAYQIEYSHAVRGNEVLLVWGKNPDAPLEVWEDDNLIVEYPRSLRAGVRITNVPPGLRHYAVRHGEHEGEVWIEVLPSIPFAMPEELTCSGSGVDPEAKDKGSFCTLDLAWEVVGGPDQFLVWPRGEEERFVNGDSRSVTLGELEPGRAHCLIFHGLHEETYLSPEVTKWCQLDDDCNLVDLECLPPTELFVCQDGYGPDLGRVFLHWENPGFIWGFYVYANGRRLGRISGDINTQPIVDVPFNPQTFGLEPICADGTVLERLERTIQVLDTSPYRTPFKEFVCHYDKRQRTLSGSWIPGDEIPEFVLVSLREEPAADPRYLATLTNWVTRFEVQGVEPRARLILQAFNRLCYGSEPVECTVGFRRGDANGDGNIDISDAIQILGFLFLGDVESDCPDGADTNDDSALDISDGVFLLNFLFLGGLPPPPPGHLSCGADPTDDNLHEWKDCQYLFCSDAVRGEP